MERISVFDMLKIGVGPSSSHTLGPWRAALRFRQLLIAETSPAQELQLELYGSLAKTGKGHGTDVALQLGLSGFDPETMDVEKIDEVVAAIEEDKRLVLDTRQSNNVCIPFDPKVDVVFRVDQQLPAHPNSMRFSASLADGKRIEEVYYSVGGGFIVREGETTHEPSPDLPFPIETADDLIRHCAAESSRISEIVWQNERQWRSEDEIRERLSRIKDVMLDSVYRGCRTEGVLPGGLNVKRRAASTAKRLLQTPTENVEEWLDAIRHQNCNFQTTLDWVSCFALSVNEENASFGRIVTAPTNGAAGVVPAVLLYCKCFCDVPDDVEVGFLLTAAQIGCLFKQGATISAALGGCQAEIGVSSAMAAAALTESLGGTPGQSLEAAEIAMEHHLGMTCDPIGGLVQIPCIERNAMGAIKAITASQLALQRDPADARVSLDAVIRTMWETAQDMNAKYKETSEGGLALQIAVNVSEC